MLGVGASGVGHTHAHGADGICSASHTKRASSMYVYEDQHWPNGTAPCAHAEARTSWEASHNTAWPAWRECAVVHSRKLFFSLVWKAGTRSLLDFVKCAFPDAEIHLLVHVKNFSIEPSLCEEVPHDYVHVAVVREPFSRFVSAYREIRYRTIHPGRKWGEANATGLTDADALVWGEHLCCRL
mgnify:CR=1 FL=1